MSTKYTLDSILAEHHRLGDAADIAARIDRASAGIGSPVDVTIAQESLYILEMLADALEVEAGELGIGDARTNEITEAQREKLKKRLRAPLASESQAPDDSREIPALLPGEAERCMEMARQCKVDPELMRKFEAARGKKDHDSLFAMTVSLPRQLKKKTLESLYASASQRTSEIVGRKEWRATGAALSDGILQAARARWSPDSSVRVLGVDEFRTQNGDIVALVDVPDTQAAVLCDPNDGFLVHYKGAAEDRKVAKEEGLFRVYVTIDPAFAESVPEHFFAICDALSAAGVRLRDGKAMNPRIVAARFDNMVFYAPQSQLAAAQAVLENYMKQHPIGQGHHPAAVAVETPGVSVAREPNAAEQRYGVAVWEEKNGAVSYTQYLCAHALSSALAMQADAPDLVDGYADFLRNQSQQV